MTAVVPDPADVEKAARALYDANNALRHISWDDVHEAVREHMRRLAVAALAAVRPSPAGGVDRLRREADFLRTYDPAHDDPLPTTTDLSVSRDAMRWDPSAEASTDSEAVARVEALADELEREATVIAVRAGVPPLDFVRLWRDDAPARIRAAIAAPVAQAGEGR